MDKPLNTFNDLLLMVFDCANGDEEACRIMDELYEELGLNEVPYKEGD